MVAALAETPAAAVHQADPAARAALLRVHPAEHLDALERLAADGGGRVDGDTVLSSRSWDAALGSAGAALAAVRSAVDGTHAFAAGRPPGHHALREHAMGFCLVGNAVVAAREAQALGAGRVLIVDWDVHHGNGTQALVEADPSVRFVSLHQWPWYPGTGAADERGVGNVFNLPRPPGLAPERYVADLWQGIEAATGGWEPEALIISAGYDAMAGDPLGGFTLEPAHYAELVERLRTRFPATPIAALLEGGYDPARVADGVVATVAALG